MGQTNEMEFSLFRISNKYGTLELVVALRVGQNILYKLRCTGPDGEKFDLYPSIEELDGLGSRLLKTYALVPNKGIIDKATYEHLTFLFENISHK